MSLVKILALIPALLTSAIPPAAARLIATAVLIAIVALPTVPRQGGDIVIGFIEQTAERPAGILAEVGSPISASKALLISHGLAEGPAIALGQLVIASATPVTGAAAIMEADAFRTVPLNRIGTVSDLFDRLELSPQQLAWGSMVLALVLVLCAGPLVHLAAIGLFATICAAVAWIALHYNGLAERLAIPENLHTTVLLIAAVAGAGIAYRALQHDPARLGLRLAGKALAIPLVPLIAQAGLVGSVSGLAWGLIPLAILTPVIPALAAAALVLQSGLGLGVMETWLAFAAMLLWRWSVSASSRQTGKAGASDGKMDRAAPETAGGTARKRLFDQTAR